MVLGKQAYPNNEEAVRYFCNWCTWM